MRDLGPEVRRRVSEDSVGKTIASMTWDEEGSYWVMTFEGGEEMCVVLMAELAADGPAADVVARGDTAVFDVVQNGVSIYGGREVRAADREEWQALAEADTLHMLPIVALIASVKDLATRLLEVTSLPTRTLTWRTSREGAPLDRGGW